MGGAACSFCRQNLQEPLSGGRGQKAMLGAALDKENDGKSKHSTGRQSLAALAFG